MKSHQTQFGFKLPVGSAKLFLATAAHHGQTPAGLSAMLVVQYLSDLRKSDPIIGFPAELAVIAQKRLAILNRWKSERKKSSKGELHAADTIVIRWALQTHGLKICKATLYSWQKNFAMRGPAGLVDHRRWKQYARPASVSRLNAQRAFEGTLTGVR